MIDKPELFLAAYDPAIRSVDGRYWVWSPPMISIELLDDAHTSVTRHDRCNTPNSLGMEDLWGGCIGLSQEWCVFYRYYDGGRDLVGRPERGVMLFAFANRKDALRGDGIQLLDEAPFSEWVLLQPLPSCLPSTGIDGRIKFPPRQCVLPPATGPLSKTVGRSLVEYDTVVDAWAAIRSIPSNERVLLKLRRNQGVWKTPELVWLENRSHRVGANMSRLPMQKANRNPRSDAQAGAAWSVDKHLLLPPLRAILKKYSAVIGLIVIALALGWEVHRSFIRAPNPSSELREIPRTETDPVRTEVHRNRGNSLFHRKPKQALESGPRHELEALASESDLSNSKSPSDSAQK